MLFTVLAVVVCFSAAAAVAGPRGSLNPITTPHERLQYSGAQAAAGCQTFQYDDGIAAYFWLSPDPDGDTMQFVRFTPLYACTLKTVNFWVYGNATVGTPGVRVSVYSASGGLPDTVISYVDVPNASVNFYPTSTVADFTSQNLVMDEEFCIVLQRTGTAADTLAFLSDEGIVGTGRSGEFYAPADSWELMVDGWGVDVNFLVRADMCCVDPPACTPGPQPDWPMLGGSFQRTFRSSAGVDNECQLTLDWIAQGDSIAASNVSSFTNVVVKDTLAFLSYYNYLACYNIKTGDTVWNLRDEGRLIMGGDNRCNVTVDDSVIYVGGGVFKAFSCVRIADGSVKWSRDVLGTPLSTGYTRFAPAVIVGDVVYVPTELAPNGDLWALNKYTGANDPSWSTNPIMFNEGWIVNGLTWTGDSLLLAGTVTNATTLTNGRLYAIRVSNGSFKWVLEDPSAIFLDPTLDMEGFSGSLAYENGILYYQSNIRDDANGFDHYPWDGSAGAIDVNVEDGSGAGILWVVGSPIGRALYGGPVLGEGLVYYNCDGIFVGDANPKGIIAVKKSNGAFQWHQPLGQEGVPMALTVTCETGTNPYLFSGSRSGLWYLIDGFTGDIIWTRTFTGMVHGTAVVDSQILVSTRSSLTGNGCGRLASFSVSGVDRPRMDLLQAGVFSTNALPGSGNTTVDTIYDALANIGCADLTINSFGVDTAALSAVRVSTTQPSLTRLAVTWADLMASDFLAFSEGFRHPSGASILDYKGGLLRDDLDEAVPSEAATVRSWTQASIARAAAAQVITVETPAPATVPVGGSLSIALRIDETGQIPRTTVRNYVTLDNTDRDFFPEDTAGTSLGAPFIPVDAIFGYAMEQDTMRANDALTLTTNHGSYGEGEDFLYYVEGDATASLFDGSFLITGKLSDTARTAWDVYDWAEFQPDTFLSIIYDTTLGTVNGVDMITGTIAKAKYIDSIGFPAGPGVYSYGVEVRETQVGFNIVGEGIEAFKLYQYCVINRNPTPVDSVIYLGSFADWDIESGANNVDTTHVSDWSNVYEYDPGSNLSAYGIIKLPRPGTDYEELDGTRDTASGFYSVYAVQNAEEVYPTGTFQPLVDHIYEYVSQPGLNSRAGFELNDDMSLAVVLDTLHLQAYDTVWVRYALWGTASGGNLSDAATSAAFGANLASGFMRGDVNADREYNFIDLVYLYRFVTLGASAYKPIPRDEQGDVNLDGNVDLTDVLYLENYMYNGGPAPVGKWWW